MKHQVVNFLAFQAGWFACVLGAAHGLPIAGAAVALGVVGLHLAMAPRALPELALAGIAVAMGLLFDSLLVSLGWVAYPSGMWLPGLAPYWILAMWAIFATTLNVSMSWLRERLPLAVVLGGVFGPLSYFAGERLGGIVFLDEGRAMFGLALGWAVFMPLLLIAARRLDGVSERPQAHGWAAAAAEERP